MKILFPPPRCTQCSRRTTKTCATCSSRGRTLGILTGCPQQEDEAEVGLHRFGLRVVGVDGGSARVLWILPGVKPHLVTRGQPCSHLIIFWWLDNQTCSPAVHSSHNTHLTSHPIQTEKYRNDLLVLCFFLTSISKWYFPGVMPVKKKWLLSKR